MKTNFNFTKYRRVYYAFSGILIIAGLAAIFIFGLKLGIDFTGGSILELEFEGQRPDIQQVQEKLNTLNLGEVVIQPVGEKGMLIRMPEILEEIHQLILGQFDNVKELRFDLIGPTIGKELTQKTQVAIVLALLAISCYIAFAFRQVSRPVSSIKYGFATLVALFHDIIIPLGILALLGALHNAEITIPIIAALLTILGFSVHDTIVIFDRVRENLQKRKSTSFEETVNLSLNQTLGRSINTVVTVLLVLLAIFFFGGETLRYFSLTLIIGIISGAYSSIFIAGPLLVSWLKK